MMNTERDIKNEPGLFGRRCPHGNVMLFHVDGTLVTQFEWDGFVVVLVPGTHMTLFESDAGGVTLRRADHDKIGIRIGDDDVVECHCDAKDAIDRATRRFNDATRAEWPGKKAAWEKVANAKSGETRKAWTALNEQERAAFPERWAEVEKAIAALNEQRLRAAERFKAKPATSRQ